MSSNMFSQAANWIFIGCMFLGIAAGMYFHEVAVGTLAGIGVGFIARGFSKINQDESRTELNNK